jgi:aminopeptidase-like protein
LASQGSSALIARSQGDGRSTLLDVARSSGLRYPVVRRAAERLEQAGLLA